MKTATGKFVRGKDRQTDDVTVQLHTSNFPTPNDWSGSFTLPKNRPAQLGPAKLVLADGRGGDIILYKMDRTGGRATVVDFWGLSPLAKVS